MYTLTSTFAHKGQLFKNISEPSVRFRYFQQVILYVMINYHYESKSRLAPFDSASL